MKPTRKPFRADVKTTHWRNVDGTTTPVVRIFAGSRSLAVDVAELPALIQQLEAIHAEHNSVDYYLDNLFIEDTK